MKRAALIAIAIAALAACTGPGPSLPTMQHRLPPGPVERRSPSPAPSATVTP